MTRRKRKTFYLGKKKRHTVKNQVMVNNRGFILHKVAYKKGRRKHHDYDIYKKNHPAIIPKEVVNVVDLVYVVGIEKDFPEQLSALPCKKNRNQKEMSQEEKGITKVILEKG